MTDEQLYETAAEYAGYAAAGAVSEAVADEIIRQYNQAVTINDMNNRLEKLELRLEKMTEKFSIMQTQMEEMQGDETKKPTREDVEKMADLSGADLSGMDLSGVNLSGKNLSQANLMETNLTGANISGADLQGANLEGANLTETKFMGADLAGANLRAANMRNVEEGHVACTDFTGANLADADLRYSDFTGSKFMGADLKGADLSNMILNMANLTSANLYKADLRETSIEDSHLTKANLANTEISRTDFTGSDLTGADLRGTDRSHACFTNTIFTGVKVDVGQEIAEEKVIDTKQVENDVQQTFGDIPIDRLQYLGDIQQDIRKNGFQPTESLKKNMFLLSEKQGKVCTLSEVKEMAKSKSLPDELRKPVNSITAECQAQEMQRPKPAPKVPEPVV